MKHNWEKHHINTVFNFEKGVLQSSKNKAGNFVFITASNEFKTHNEYYYDTEALCFAFAASGSLGRTHYFNGKFIASDLVYVLTPKKEYKDKIELKFHYYFLNHFKEEIVRMTKSGTSKVSINREAFSKIEIPIPPLSTQNKVIVTLDKVKSRLDEIKTLREKQTKDINNLLFSKYTDMIESAEWLPMKEIAPIHRRQLEINPDETYLRIGVRSFGRGLFENPSFKGSELTWQKIFRMNEGDLLFSNANGWEGAVGLIPKKYDGWVGSHRYITCLPNLEIINPEFLFYYFTTFEGVGKLSQASPGTVARTRTLNNKLLMQIDVPVPSIELQKEFVELLEKTNAIKEYHKQTELELTELMPSLLDKAFKGEL
jgi:type I restriction enzyme S subunit